MAEQEIDISGSGKYNAGDLRSETVDAEISGLGDATVWATDTLDASGSGSVNYYGNPRTSFSGSGSWKLNSRGDK